MPKKNAQKNYPKKCPKNAQQQKMPPKKCLKKNTQKKMPKKKCPKKLMPKNAQKKFFKARVNHFCFILKIYSK